MSQPASATGRKGQSDTPMADLPGQTPDIRVKVPLRPAPQP